MPPASRARSTATADDAEPDPATMGDVIRLDDAEYERAEARTTIEPLTSILDPRARRAAHALPARPHAVGDRSGDRLLANAGLPDHQEVARATVRPRRHGLGRVVDERHDRRGDGMTSRRARAYARVTMTLDNLGPAKLLGPEPAQIPPRGGPPSLLRRPPERCVGARRVRRRRGATRAPGGLRPLEPGARRQPRRRRLGLRARAGRLPSPGRVIGMRSALDAGRIRPAALFDAWLFAEADATLALAAWGSAPSDDKAAAYATYRAALDREAQAAQTLQRRLAVA